MQVKWSRAALADLRRLYEFLESIDQPAAARTIQSLTAAPTRLMHQPRIGERLDEFEAREVRRLLVGNYEIRYELSTDALYVLRVWHTREHR